MKTDEKNIIWKTKRKDILLTPFPRWMGILNVTPDSFSDGGSFGLNNPGEDFRIDIDAAYQKGGSLLKEGADIIDVGGESTRPGSLPVPPQEQLKRVLPVIERLVSLGLPISIDTTSAEVAEESLRAGASIVNDISGASFDPEMIGVVRKYGAGICLGHIRGIPETMQIAPFYEDAPREIASFLRQKSKELVQSGIDPKQIVLDPGIGFGKNLSHNTAILSQLELLTDLGYPLLIGHSRKRFLTELDQRAVPPVLPGFNADRRDILTAALTKYLVRKGVAIFRVHNVELNRQSITNPDFPELLLQQFFLPFTHFE